MGVPPAIWTDAEMLDALDYLELCDFFASAHQQPAAQTADSFAAISNGNGILARTAIDGAGGGVKVASIYPSTDAASSVQSVYVLFDQTGTPQAMMGAQTLTWFKTASDSALGSRFLSRSDAKHLLMVGAGSMAPHLIAAHCAVRPSIERVSIWNRNPGRAKAVAQTIEGVNPTVVEDLASIATEADIITVATLSADPIVRGEWLAPGTHVDLVGAYRPDMREADDALITRCRIFVDSHHTTYGDIGELSIPIHTGTISRTDIRGDLYQLCSGVARGRESEDERTVFKNGGGGHLDLMTARFVAQTRTPGFGRSER